MGFRFYLSLTSVNYDCLRSNPPAKTQQKARRISLNSFGGKVMQVKKLHHRLPLVFGVTFALAVMVLLPITAQADDNTVTFLRTDNPGSWFQNVAGPIAGTQSLAVAKPGVEVRFKDGESNAIHTVTSLIFPTGAVGMPFDSRSLNHNDPRPTLFKTPGPY